MNVAVVDELRQPEYTGENRCLACTAVNLVIAALFGAAITRKSRRAGAVAFAISVALIYLRGYLVPGTPRLTKEYLPAEVLAWFGKEPSPPVQQGLGAVDENGHAAAPGPASNGSGDEGDLDVVQTDGDGGRDDVDPEAFLLETGALEPCADRDDLCLDDDFRDAWAEAIDAIDAESLSGDDAVSAFDLDDAEDVEIQSYDEASVLAAGDATIGQWPSQAALVADVAAARVFDDEEPRWDDLDPEARGRILDGLRIFLDTCPTDGGPVELGTETVESCCQSYDVIAATCAESGDRLFEQPVAEPEA